jgi:NAD-dependent SIR2 family protein deacetylase
MVIMLAGHEIEAIDEVYFFDVACDRCQKKIEPEQVESIISMYKTTGAVSCGACEREFREGYALVEEVMKSLRLERLAEWREKWMSSYRKPE